MPAPKVFDFKIHSKVCHFDIGICWRKLKNFSFLVWCHFGIVPFMFVRLWDWVLFKSLWVCWCVCCSRCSTWLWSAYRFKQLSVILMSSILKKPLQCYWDLSQVCAPGIWVEVFLVVQFSKSDLLFWLCLFVGSLREIMEVCSSLYGVSILSFFLSPISLVLSSGFGEGGSFFQSWSQKARTLYLHLLLHLGLSSGKSNGVLSLF